jgi:hypothetical protein
MEIILTALIAFSSLIFTLGCSPAPKLSMTDKSSSSEPAPNTTDTNSVDHKASTFVALARLDHTTERLLARCGIQCPNLGKNFGGFWSMPASQVNWVGIQRSEVAGLHSE